MATSRYRLRLWPSWVRSLGRCFTSTGTKDTPLSLPVAAATQSARPGGSARPADAGAEIEAGMTKADGVVDRLSTTMQELRTTVQVPLKQPVLVGGMTLDPGLGARAGQPSPALYLVVEVVAD